MVIAIGLTGCTQQQRTDQSSSAVMEAATIDLLVGTYTNETSEGIYQLQFNPETGELSDSVLLVKAAQPSYLAIAKDRKSVFAVNETNEGGVSTFNWDHDANKLSLVSFSSSEGAHPCYIGISQSGRELAVANYSSGNIALFQLGEGLALKVSPQVRQHEGSGPVKPNQNGPHAHCSVFKNNYLYVVDLGIDQIRAYPMQANGDLGEGSLALALQPGDGPRHLIFHPNNKMAFVVNELSSTVVSLNVDHEKGLFKVIDRSSTLPEGFDDTNFDADVHLSSDGKFLYVSNRGHDSIAIFSVAPDGQLSALGHQSVEGKWPRNFTLSPEEKYLLVANQETNNIVVLKRDSVSGLLSSSGHIFSMSKPVCLKF